ncbi:hypothetical protein BHE74_00024601 [Ensete ventricosum]|nr:hypothetical protein BHE74_00024601 [Ensete ventricosum]
MIWSRACRESVGVQTIWSGAHQDFARGWLGFGRCYRELAESLTEVGQSSDDVVGSSLRVIQRLVSKLVESSSMGCQELAESLPDGCWESIGSSSKEIGSSPGVQRKDIGSSPRDQLTIGQQRLIELVVRGVFDLRPLKNIKSGSRWSRVKRNRELT